MNTIRTTTKMENTKKVPNQGHRGEEYNMELEKKK